MSDRDRTKPPEDETHQEPSTKPSGTDVGPPEERVDDETPSDDSKRTHRQE